MTLARALPADLERCTSYRIGVTRAQLYGAIGRWVLWSPDQAGGGGSGRHHKSLSTIVMALFGCSAGVGAARDGVPERHGAGQWQGTGGRGRISMIGWDVLALWRCCQNELCLLSSGKHT